MTKTYRAKSLRHVEPITFAIDTEDGEAQEFRVPRKPRQDVLVMLATAMVLDPKTGIRTYPNDVIRRAMIVMVANEMWDPTVVVDPGTPDTTEPAGDGISDPIVHEGTPAQLGAWVHVDDQRRFIDYLNSDRHIVDDELLGEICWDLIEELTGNPTGAPKP